MKEFVSFGYLDNLNSAILLSVMNTYTQYFAQHIGAEFCLKSHLNFRQRVNFLWGTFALDFFQKIRQTTLERTALA